MRLVIGISGATGAQYGVRLLEVVSQMSGVETHLILTRLAEEIIAYETDWSVEQVKALASYRHSVDELAAPISSGSFRTDGMVVIPCSMKSLSAIAHSYNDNLLVRAADVTLKEKRPLIVVVRETPLHIGHLRNMLQLAEMGGVILPPMPSFYHRPRSLDDIIDQTVGRVLDLVGLEHNLTARWAGIGSRENQT